MISKEASFSVSVTNSATHRIHILDYVIAIDFPSTMMKTAVGAQFATGPSLRGVRTHHPSRFLKVGETKSVALFVNATVCFLPFFLTKVTEGPVIHFIPFNIIGTS
jgi:hypothetical protein